MPAADWPCYRDARIATVPPHIAVAGLNNGPELDDFIPAAINRQNGRLCSGYQMGLRLFSTQLRLNMLSGLLATAANIAVLLAAYPVYLGYLGLEVYGVWLILATVLQVALLGDLGISQTVTKLVAEEHARDNRDGVQQFVLIALVMIGLAGSCIAAVVIVFASPIVVILGCSAQTETIASKLLPYIAIVSVYAVVTQVFHAALSGIGRMDLANYSQAMSRLVGAVVSVVCLVSGLGI